VVQRVQKELKAKHHFTTANCPWSNGTIESACKQVIRAFRAVLSELKMYADEWPEVVNMVQSVLNNYLSTRLNKRTPMQVFTEHAETTARADVEGQRACQRASGLYQGAEAYGG
jgi:IS30 family transposase